MTPNHITTARLVTAIAAATAFAMGEGPWILAGSALFILSFFLDRADGVLARLTGKTTPWGHTYDLISDGVANAAVFVGIGVGLRGTSLGGLAIVLGLLAGLAVALILWLVMRVEEQAGARAAEISMAIPLDPDDAMLVVPIIMALGGGVPLLIAAAIGAPGFAVFMFWKFRKQLQTPSGSVP